MHAIATDVAGLRAWRRATRDGDSVAELVRGGIRERTGDREIWIVKKGGYWYADDKPLDTKVFTEAFKKAKEMYPSDTLKAK